MNNISSVGTFELMILVSTPEWQIIYFVLFFFIYAMTVLWNLMIIVIIQLDSRLHKPMYFFLANLSFIEISYATAIIPSSLNNILQDKKTISFIGCFTQMFLLTGLESSECVLLSCMAYDRYVAICQPLVYLKIMKPLFCVQLMVVSWSIGFSNSLGHTVWISTMSFCKDNFVHDFFCDIPSIVNLSCTYSLLDQLASIVIGGCIIVASCTLTLFSYICILRVVLNIHSAGGRRKAFSTCGSHLTVVTLYFGTVISAYVLPDSSSYDENKRVISVMYGIITPFINPIVYSFRNTDFQKAIHKMLIKRKISCKCI